MLLFDELNNLEKDEILDIDTYFDEMELSKEEKEKRKKFAKDFFEITLLVFALFSIMKEYNYIKTDFIITRLQSKYLELVKKHGIDVDDNIKTYIHEFSEEIASTTERHIEEKYFLSQDRATIISENEAQTILGYSQLSEAIKKGYTKKTWITEGDKKVRETHQRVDRETIPIEEFFLVGDSLMMYPHDNITADVEASEVINCRCSIKYI